MSKKEKYVGLEITFMNDEGLVVYDAVTAEIIDGLVYVFDKDEEVLGAFPAINVASVFAAFE